MLSKFRVQRYKSLFDTEIELEPLTVLIGPNGSGKSNICESLFMLSDFLEKLLNDKSTDSAILPLFLMSLKTQYNQDLNFFQPKLWHGEFKHLLFEISNSGQMEYDAEIKLSIYLDLVDLFSTASITLGSVEKTQNMNYKKTNELKNFMVTNDFFDSSLANALKKVFIYDFIPKDLSTKTSSSERMDRTGKGITNSLVDILHENRESFVELEERLTRLVPNIKRISLPRGDDQGFVLELIDKYSGYRIDSSEISDGTLRILGFLTAIYQKDTPSIICFEELENGVHPWLLHKLVELLQIVSTEGINGKPVQVLITTHSPLLLNYVKPEQIRAVELDKEGKTQVHKLPTDSVRFQKALEAYDNDLGELWFTNIFGGNPQ
ncbi:MAG: AAA family ATPase [Microcystaceae cyanobacterium]